MPSESGVNGVQKSVYLLMGVTLAGLLVVPFAQLGQAQEMEGLVRLQVTEEFTGLMRENPEAAGERLFGPNGVHFTYEGERPIRVRLYLAVVAEGEIRRQYLSETAVTIEPGTSKSLARPKETFLSGSELISGMNWVPTSTWVPNPEIVPEGLRFHEETYAEGGPFIANELRKGLFSASELATNDMLYLAAVPLEEYSRSVGSLPLVIGGPDIRFSGSKWAPVDKRK